MSKRQSARASGYFWHPSSKANCVQIGSFVTARRPRETVAALLDRAIRTYPDKGATLVVIGWRPESDDGPLAPSFSG